MCNLCYDDFMFTDTHCHMSHFCERGMDTTLLIQELVTIKTPFVLDAGTLCNDLPSRVQLLYGFIDLLADDSQKNAARDLFRFSAGIWPDIEAIEDRVNQMAELEKNVQMTHNGLVRACAIGECGLDHHWNKVDADGKIKGKNAADIFYGEAELFEMQLVLAQKLNLPVIVHSREAFDGTLSCIRNVGWNNGVIHCYSYGIDEARKFIDEGWYISLSGAVTYAKKAQLEQMQELIRFIPSDRLLLETDAPYLAPVPKRGKTNTPLFVEYIYRFVAEVLGMSEEELSKLILTNAQRLFG